MREVVRRLARDQAIRERGTPRITVLVGGEWARQLWTEWVALMKLDGQLYDGPIDAAIDGASATVARCSTACVAVLVTPTALARWSRDRADRKRAMIDEGVLLVPEPPAKPPRVAIDARSAAEAKLFDALERSKATAGLFDLNGTLSVRFGPAAAEIDLICRKYAVAVEIDGFYHFTDLDAYRRDRRKDVLLQCQGFLVVRVHANDVVQDMPSVMLQINTAIAARRPKR